MDLRKKLRYTFNVAFVVAAVSLIFLLFALGHAETFSVEFIIAMASLASLAAIVLAILQWIGLPKPTEEKTRKGRRSRQGS